jgi:hypothetical protein
METIEKDGSTFYKLQGQQLAKLLGVSTAALSLAAKKDHLCQRFPVASWADRTVRGKLIAYYVPEDDFKRIESGAAEAAGSQAGDEVSTPPEKTDEQENTRPSQLLIDEFIDKLVSKDESKR